VAGFHFRYRISGGAPTIQRVVFKDTETITKGDLVNLESGQLDLGATADTNLVGVALETAAGTSAVTLLTVITDPDAVYGVTDANARLIGATLDLSGATGAQGVATSSNKEFVVVATSSATEETLVRINVGKHYQNKAQ
jgi:hypothetical protein